MKEMYSTGWDSMIHVESIRWSLGRIYMVDKCTTRSISAFDQMCTASSIYGNLKSA